MSYGLNFLLLFMQNKFIFTGLQNPAINTCVYYPFQKQQQISTTTKQNLLGLLYLFGKSSSYMSFLVSPICASVPISIFCVTSYPLKS